MTFRSEEKRSKITENSSKKYRIFVLLALFVCLIIPKAAWAEDSVGPEQIILTWTQDPATTQTITWLTPNIEANQVCFMEATRFEGDFATARLMDAITVPFGNSQYRCTVTVSGLDPNTKYVYRVGNEENWSKTLSFTTSSHPDDFSFLYLGDVQEGYAAWGRMLENIAHDNPQIKFSILGGDLTDNGGDVNEWGEFLNAAASIFSGIPMLPAKGNHDKDLFLDFFSLPDNGPRNVIGNCFYSFDYGNAHFVVLDTGNIITESVGEWLQQDLQNTNKKWKFAIFHHPAYQYFGDNKTIDDAIQEYWIPILEQNKADMVFVGHQHVYMRTHPIYQNKVVTDSYGIVYVMGNSGAKLYGTGQGFPYVARAETGSNYQVIELEGDVLTLSSMKSNGELIETYSLCKNPVYEVLPDVADPAYVSGISAEGICTMTVKPGISGFKYFIVRIEPKVPHCGKETVIFTHSRNNSMLQISATIADFDEVGTAQAGFNVDAGDVVKAYIVDELNNAKDCNPVILQ